VTNAVGNVNSLKDRTFLALWALGTDAAENIKQQFKQEVPTHEDRNYRHHRLVSRNLSGPPGLCEGPGRGTGIYAFPA
jgi:hypothetical protein